MKSAVRQRRRDVKRTITSASPPRIAASPEPEPQSPPPLSLLAGTGVAPVVVPTVVVPAVVVPVVVPVAVVPAVVAPAVVPFPVVVTTGLVVAAVRVIVIVDAEALVELLTDPASA